MFLRYPRGKKKKQAASQLSFQKERQILRKNETPPTIIKTSIKSSLKKKLFHPKSS